MSILTSKQFSESGVGGERRFHRHSVLNPGNGNLRTVLIEPVLQLFNLCKHFPKRLRRMSPPPPAFPRVAGPVMGHTCVSCDPKAASERAGEGRKERECSRKPLTSVGT